MKQLTASVLGFGDRSQIYSKYALKHPDQMKIVAIVEPNDIRRNLAKDLFHLAEEQCFSDYNQFIAKGKIADFVINGTMDKIHIETTMPLLPLGYDVLLEKPITSDKKQLQELLAASKKYGNKIVVCHVLRYVEFYKSIKQLILSGEIGEVRHIETSENVGVAHASISFIRGKWNNEKKCGSTYMMQKCCHDTDMICWLNNKTIPKSISSQGSKSYFIGSKAPKGAGTRCLVDCEIEKECPYSAQKLHIENNPMINYVWDCIQKLPEELTLEERIESLKTNNDHGKCIYKTDSDIVDQQMMTILFEDGSTAYHGLISSCARAGRRIKVYGTKGEIEGFSEEYQYTVRLYNSHTILYDERVVKLAEDADAGNHYGGDTRIMNDLLHVLNNEKPSVSTTLLDDSIFAHLCVIAADEAMQKNKIVDIVQI